MFSTTSLLAASATMLLVLLLLTTSFEPAAALEYQKVRLLSYVPANETGEGDHFLFRSDEPVINNQFKRSILLQFMKWRAYEHRIIINDTNDFENYYLVDISLNNNITDNVMQDIESDYFLKNPNLGEMWMFPLCGEATDPYTLTTQQQKEYVNSPKFEQCDQFPTRIKKIYDSLHNNNNHNGNNEKKNEKKKKKLLESSTTAATRSKIFFIHCSSGSDRTGSISSSFLLYAQKSRSCQNVLQYSTKIADRMLAPPNKNSMVWYCLYLKFKQSDKYHDLDCANATDVPFPTFAPQK